jgi:CPA1 family monovalent cation:H+ antiporter
LELSPFDLATAFIVAIAVIGWFNARRAHLPTAVATTLVGCCATGVLLGMRHLGVGGERLDHLIDALRGINFSKTVFGYLLAFLLFAGAMQVDLAELRRRRLSIWSLATVGVLASTFIVGGGLWAVARALSLDLPLAWAMVFGALISPTDPIAVLAAVRSGSLSKTLQVVLQGEALFNDGVGIVVFTAALAVATGGGAPDLPAIGLTVVLKAAGGLLLGLGLGWACVRALRAVDDYVVEVTITLAAAMGAYALGERLSVSGPIAVVAAGLLVGNTGMATAMSDETQRYVHGFWELVDEILNAVLFLLLGLELAVVGVNLRYAALWGAAALLVWAARFAVVAPWGGYLSRLDGKPGATALLGWGGLHGALSLALALTIPPSAVRELILSTTFVVVVLSVVAQGLTFPWLTRRMGRAPSSPDGSPQA